MLLTTAHRLTSPTLTRVTPLGIGQALPHHGKHANASPVTLPHRPLNPRSDSMARRRRGMRERELQGPLLLSRNLGRSGASSGDPSTRLVGIPPVHAVCFEGRLSHCRDVASL